MSHRHSLVLEEKGCFEQSTRFVARDGVECIDIHSIRSVLKTNQDKKRQALCMNIYMVRFCLFCQRHVRIVQCPYDIWVGKKKKKRRVPFISINTSWHIWIWTLFLSLPFPLPLLSLSLPLPLPLPLSVSHNIHEWVMSHLNESCHVWITHTRTWI